MTTHGRESRVSRLAASLGDAGRPAASEPAPEELPPAPPVAGPDRRIRIAWHEAGHATALIHLLGPDAVVAASIRRGRSFHGVTLLGAPPTDRRGSELRIVATLCGDLAAQLPPPGTGYDETSDDATADEAAAVAAAASLERLVPLARERLLEA